MVSILDNREALIEIIQEMGLKLTAYRRINKGGKLGLGFKARLKLSTDDYIADMLDYGNGRIFVAYKNDTMMSLFKKTLRIIAKEKGLDCIETEEYILDLLVELKEEKIQIKKGARISVG